MTGITFDSNSLQTADIVTDSIDHHDMPTKDVNLYQIAHGNRSILAFYNYVSKKIVLRGSLVASSNSAFDTLMDTFKGYFTGQDKSVDIDYAGGTRRYVASNAAVSITRPGGLAFGTFQVDITCAIPFGKDTTESVLSTESAVTASPHNTNITLLGNAEFQYPSFEITINSLTDGINKTVSIGNNANGQVCSITRDWVGGDIITIDSFTSLVKVNSTEVEFTGSVPIFESGPGVATYSDNFTARNLDQDIGQFGFWL